MACPIHIVSNSLASLDHGTKKNILDKYHTEETTGALDRHEVGKEIPRNFRFCLLKTQLLDTQFTQLFEGVKSVEHEAKSIIPICHEFSSSSEAYTHSCQVFKVSPSLAKPWLWPIL